MSECTHNCSTCGESCAERTEPQDLHVPVNGLSHVGKVIAVVSGKGGVGKSTVTASLAVAMAKKGRNVANSGCRHHRPLHSHRLWHPPEGHRHRCRH